MNGDYDCSYYTVYKLNNQFAAVYINNDRFADTASMRLEDEKTAQATAKTFADAQEVYCLEKVKILERPYSTIVRENDKWLPALVYSDKVITLRKVAFKDNNKSSIACVDKETATTLAMHLPHFENFEFVPFLGEFLAKKPSKELKEKFAEQSVNL